MYRTHFVQECPVCGRPLEILVEYLGRRVACNHCGGQFLAVDPEHRTEEAPRDEQLLDRAEALLDASEHRPLDQHWQ